LGSPSTITEEKLSYLVDAGMYEIQMGIETACERTRKLYRRTTTNETVLKAARSINKFKSSVTAIYDFILDNPYETKEDIAETLAFILKLPRPFHLQLFSLIFFPGTELYHQAKKDGFITDEEKDVYRKQFQFIQVRYLNLIFYLFNYGAPNFLIKPLLNKYIIALFERKAVSRILKGLVAIMKRIKRLKSAFNF
jgi:coproporphyrinogen III oxidase-like Fe-S oxidoreductase